MRRVLILIGLLIGVVSVNPAMAQTLTVTPTPALSPSPAATQAAPEVDIQYRTEVAFPHQVFFQANINMHIDLIERVDLIIETINDTRVEISYPETPFFLASDLVIASYVWQIPRDNPPPLFQPIRYTWRVTPKSGQAMTNVQTIEFTDQRIQWSTTQAMSGAVTLTAPQVVSRNVGALEVDLSETLRLLQKEANQTPRVKLLVYDADQPIGCGLNADGEPVYQAFLEGGFQEEQPCEIDQAKAIYAESGYTVIQLGTDRTLASSLSVPLVRESYATLWAGKSVPLWFSEGLVQFYKRQPNRDALFTSREALRSNTPFTLSQMNELPSLDSTIVWDAQAYGMLLYLASRVGVDDVFALARDIVDAESFEQAFTARTGFGTGGLINAWQTWLFKREAENAYLYTPYLATTATPTPTSTNTATRIPPTPTVTPTATIELSPTLRPSATRRPPTPTITPLPAGSFNLRPTAIPAMPIASTPMDIVTRGNNPIIIGVGVLAVLLVIVVTFITGRRRG